MLLGPNPPKGTGLSVARKALVAAEGRVLEPRQRQVPLQGAIPTPGSRRWSDGPLTPPPLPTTSTPEENFSRILFYERILVLRTNDRSEDLRPPWSFGDWGIMYPLHLHNGTNKVGDMVVSLF